MGSGVDKSPTINESELKQRSCCARYFSGGIQPPQANVIRSIPVKLVFTITVGGGQIEGC